MVESRKYRASLDDGHDYSEIEYYSEHRANSKQNIEDCKQAIISKFGYNRYKKLKITQIYKI